ncbi:MAG: DEAD/DEAH box helicase, partial [Deltaproteobacteria bacterium]|nr:DEAD/DEAH box helicase [Deltaproteobacteria bacterium]
MSDIVYYQGQFEELYPHGERVGLLGLNSPALARLITRLMEGPLAKKSLLVVTPTPLEAEDLMGDLSFFWPGGEVIFMPQLESIPFMGQTVGPEAMAERLKALHTLAWPRSEKNPAAPGGAVVVAAAPSLLRLTPEPSELLKRSLSLTLGDEVGFDALKVYLSKSGYNSVGQVESVADYSVKGGIVDVFPAGFGRPVRLDFFGDFLDSIRIFRVDDQKSIGNLDSIVLPPASESLRNKANFEAGAEGIKKLAEKHGWLWLLWEPIARRLREGLLTADLDDWGPLWEPRKSSVVDYLGENSAVILMEPGRIVDGLDAADLNLQNHFSRLAEQERPHLPREALYAKPLEVIKGLAQRGRSLYVSIETTSMGSPGLGLFSTGETLASGELGLDKKINFAIETNRDLKALSSVPRRETGLLGPLAARVKGLLGRGLKVSLVLRSQEQLKRLATLLAEYDLSPGVGPGSGKTRLEFSKSELVLTVGQLSSGFVSPFEGEAYLSEDEILGTRQRLRRKSKEEFRGLKGFAGLKDLSPGDYVVHNDYGIGQYLGLVTKTIASGEQGDFLHLMYKGEERLFLPVERFSVITKYVGASDRPPALDRIGSGSWEKVKFRVKENMREVAEELLKLYASRQNSPGYAFSKRDPEMAEFEAAFEYEPTADQERSIDEVLEDLASARPMDRLVCGDVGYGKTEVAMRAAFKVVNEGKQVAVLVPTTILCEQHERTFTERFSQWPFIVSSLSRFKTRTEQKEIIRKLAQGTVDIVIGTHRILQKDVLFKDLGLLIIDEEHRFGVMDKEKLKKYRNTVDILSMSATPIPRSLAMSMNGIRDMSVIETSPQDRLAVKTSLIARNDEAMVAAINQELARGGQVFLVHNRVRDIELWLDHLRSLMPLFKFDMGHGQMTTEALEAVMERFIKKEIDVWVTTTIVESGLDFPLANTIIIDQADRFGLAQLYQLRGRVGRGNLQAYCYLMVDDPDTLSPDAQ